MRQPLSHTPVFSDSALALERGWNGRTAPVRRVGSLEVVSETTEAGPPITIHAGGPDGGLVMLTAKGAHERVTVEAAWGRRLLSSISAECSGLATAYELAQAWVGELAAGRAPATI